MALIPDGRYRGFFENPEIAISANKNTPCVKGIARIVDETAGNANNSRIETELWLTDNSAERAIQSLIYAGCTFPPKPGETEPDLENFEGCGSQEVEFQIETEEYTPEATTENPKPRTTKRSRVAFINKVGGSRATKPVDESQRKMIAKTFSGVINKARAAISAPKAAGDASFNTSDLEGGKPPTAPAKHY